MSDKNVIVIADDFEDGRVMLAQFLTFKGFDVVQAIDGEQALDLARSLKAKVVLMDIAMPHMDGFEATRRLKRDAATKDAFVIMLTAMAHKGDEIAAVEAGCDAYLAKPYDMKELLTLLRHAIPSSIHES